MQSLNTHAPTHTSYISVVAGHIITSLVCVCCSGHKRRVRRRDMSQGEDEQAQCHLPVRRSHWLELEFPTPVEARVLGLRCTGSASCHTNGPRCWLLEGTPLSLEEEEEERKCSNSASFTTYLTKWVTLQAVGLRLGTHHTSTNTTTTNGGGCDGVTKTSSDITTPKPPTAAGIMCVPDVQSWEYDTSTFANGSVPNQTRFYDITLPGVTAGVDNASSEPRKFKRFRLKFFGEREKGELPCSVQLSGVLLFGRLMVHNTNQLQSFTSTNGYSR